MPTAPPRASAAATVAVARDARSRGRVIGTSPEADEMGLRLSVCVRRREDRPNAATRTSWDDGNGSSSAQDCHRWRRSVGDSDAPIRQPAAAAADPKGPSNDAELARDSNPEPVMLEPTDAELDEWAERERSRRQAWLSGPTDDERAAWAKQERMRRLSQLSDADREAMFSEWTRQMVRYPREMQLAAEGMLSLFYQWSRRQMAEFIRAGRDWEDQVGRTGRRRRVHLDDDEE